MGKVLVEKHVLLFEPNIVRLEFGLGIFSRSSMLP